MGMNPDGYRERVCNEYDAKLEREDRILGSAQQIKATQIYLDNSYEGIKVRLLKRKEELLREANDIDTVLSNMTPELIKAFRVADILRKFGIVL